MSYYYAAQINKNFGTKQKLLSQQVTHVLDQRKPLARMRDARLKLRLSEIKG